MSEPDTPSHILCMSVADAKEVTAGSTQTNCFRCDKSVWISPAGVAIVLEHDVPPICFECALKEPTLGSPLPPTPEQMEEIIRHFKK